MKRKFHLAWVAMSLGSALAGCSRDLAKDPAAAGAVVANFREETRKGNPLVVYRSGAQNFREAISEDRWLEISLQVERQLGAFRSSEPNGGRFAWKRSGPEWLLGFKSQYELGEAREHFLIRREDGEWKLAGYHIGSDQLTEPEN